MVAQRRFGPLIALVFVGFGILCVRLFQVQIVEHKVWAQQAAGLVRTSRVLPSQRGSIMDRNGRVLVHDEYVYDIDLRYRDFRRRHPLGVLTHAYSSLALRPIPIADALAQRAAWTAALLRLSPADLDRFEKGEALDVGPVRVPKTPTPSQELRVRRAADLRYYLGQLLGLTREDYAYLRKLEGPARETTYLDCVAAVRAWSPEDVAARVEAHVSAACGELAHLAEAYAAFAHEKHGGTAHQAGSPLDALIALLESTRAEIEDESADELFQTAAGFRAGAISTESLAAVFDLDWIARLLRWDDARLRTWVETRAARHDARIEGFRLPRALVHVELEMAARRPERLLDELAFIYSPASERDEESRPPSWRDLDRLTVLDQLGSLFADARLPRGVNVPDVVLPLQDQDLRSVVPNPDDPWKIVGLVSDVAGKSESGLDEPLREPSASAAWKEFGADRSHLESPETIAELVRLQRALARRHRAAIDRLLASLLSAARHSDDQIARLSFTDARKKRAEVRDRYVQVDRGNRPVRLISQPDYELVQRIARHPDLCRGFEVRENTKRVPLVRDADGDPLAALLIGSVSQPMLRDMIKQQGDERRLAELSFMLVRSAAEDRELLELVGRVQRSDQWAGAWGLEDYLDPELRGRPGWLQTEGLEERARNDAGAALEAPRNGLDVALTLDADLQIAAQQVISHPRAPDGQTDRAWFENPVGAIVLMSVDGDVLAAASAPMQDKLPTIPGRDLERSIKRERTLQRPTFNPPGSVFKPFVAAYALEKLGFDTGHTFECRASSDGRGSFETMHCTGIHGTSDLRKALTVSCNSYFAQLGLEYDVDAAVDMAQMFGFTEPTGIKSLGNKGRSGLREEILTAPELRSHISTRRDFMRFGNGLTVLSVVPMQVARATAGLATGMLPDVRIVDSIGGRKQPHTARRLPIREEHLASVRSALRQVVVDGSGSAHAKGLDDGSLGFSFACKTGSGDYLAFSESSDLIPADLEARTKNKVRKHTWVAGWFPADAPRVVVVIYVHDTSETSSHTAVYVAAQMLQTQAVKQFLAKPRPEDGQ
ncbi:MAG: hypothetical protein JNL28_08930 [Planctomycetes bacterium]|nr:hypothetical protein [Planctomycetota bacterium]